MTKFILKTAVLIMILSIAYPFFVKYIDLNMNNEYVREVRNVLTLTAYHDMLEQIENLPVE